MNRFIIGTPCFVFFAMTLILPYNTRAQQYANHTWSHIMSGDDHDESLLDLAIDGEQNIYAAGTFEGRIDLAGTIIQGRTDGNRGNGIVYKSTPSGEILWIRKLAGSVGFLQIEVDSHDNVYVFIATYESLYIDDVNVIPHDPAVPLNNYLIKFTKDGSLVWHKKLATAASFNGLGWANGFRIAHDEIYIITAFGGSVTVEGIPLSTPPFEARNLFARFDLNGNLIVIKLLPPVGIEQMEVDKDGAFFITGTFGGTISFDATTTITSVVPDTGDLYVARFNASGNFLWVKTGMRQQAVAYNQIGRTLATDSEGSVYIMGWLKGPVKFDNVVLTANLRPDYSDTDLVLAKYSHSGDLQFAKLIMTETFGHVYRMHMQGDTLVAAGIYRGGLFKPFFALFNTEGDSIGGKVFYAGAMPFDVARDEHGNTYLAGAVSFNFTNSNCDSPPLMPTWDGFMIKEGPCQATPPPAPQLQLHCRTIDILNEGYCIEWLRDGISMGSVNSLEVRASGKYEVIFSNGCDVSASTVIEIDIDTLMTEPVQPIVQQNCRELQIKNSTPAYTISWTKNNLTIPDEHSATLSINSADSYNAIFHNACGSTSSSIAVNQNSFQTQIPQLKVECDVIEIINSNDIGTFEWFKDGERLFYTSRVLRVVESGEYMVLSNNACGELQSETISLSVPDEGMPELYNIITPNGDGKNDLYEVKDHLRGSGLLVVNRWGKVVYTSENYQNDWNARDVAPGIYFYTINNQCFGQFKGTLTIKQ